MARLGRDGPTPLAPGARSVCLAVPLAARTEPTDRRAFDAVSAESPSDRVEYEHPSDDTAVHTDALALSCRTVCGHWGVSACGLPAGESDLYHLDGGNSTRQHSGPLAHSHSIAGDVLPEREEI
jgi:hypothetical protein